MNSINKDVDIATQIRLVDWLKAEIIDGVASLFKALLQFNRESITDALARIIIMSYLLGNKLGITFNKIETKIVLKLEHSIQEAQGIEEWSSDLTQLKKYINKV